MCEVVDIPSKGKTSFAEDFKRKVHQNQIRTDLMEIWRDSNSTQEFLYLKAEYHQERRKQFRLIKNENQKPTVVKRKKGSTL